MNEKAKLVVHELKNHAPFTLFGSLTAIIFIILIIKGNLLSSISPHSEAIFYILHPTHIFLSAIVTTTLYVKYNKKSLVFVMLIGCIGSIGIATISDSIIPYLGELLVGLSNPGAHIGFLEQPFLTIPPAIIGVILGYWKGFSKFPHAGHILISTWASLFHILMAVGNAIDVVQTIGIFIFLFLAVWLPCCTSDIIYPLILAKSPYEVHRQKTTGTK